MAQEETVLPLEVDITRTMTVEEVIILHNQAVIKVKAMATNGCKVTNDSKVTNVLNDHMQATKAVDMVLKTDMTMTEETRAMPVRLSSMKN